MTHHANPQERRRIAAATLAAAVIAAVILVCTILPAEYGIDPTGVGHALGLTALADVGTEAPSAAAAAPVAAVTALQSDTYEVELRPFEGAEYKYRLAQGGALIYSWSASEPVEFEFHGEPDGAPPKYFDSYSKGEGASASGSFTAAKAGIHGWYWKNNGANRVKVTLKSAGFYPSALEFRDGERIQKKFDAR